MNENLGNIEYHKGWVLERNPEPDKLHNKFAWAEKHGVSISIGPGEIGESMPNNNRRLFEMFFEDNSEDITIETIDDVRQLFKNELFHNPDNYSKAMKKAMSLCIMRMHESEEPDYSGLDNLVEFLEKFIEEATRLNESEETDKVKLAVISQAKAARTVATNLIATGIDGGRQRLDFDNVEPKLISAVKLYYKALQIAADTSDARHDEYRAIIKDILDALNSVFDELKQRVSDAYKTASILIYHCFGDNLVVQPEELSLNYYIKHFLSVKV